MKYTGTIWLSTIVILIILNACYSTEPVEIDYEQVSDRNYVVYSLLHPGDSVFVYLFEAYNVNTNPIAISDLAIDDAIVSIHSPGSTLSLAYHNPTGAFPYYSAMLPEGYVIPGHSYNLNIDLASDRTLKANTTIPTNKVEFTSFETSNTRVEEDGPRYELLVDLKLVYQDQDNLWLNSAWWSSNCEETSIESKSLSGFLDGSGSYEYVNGSVTYKSIGLPLKIEQNSLCLEYNHEYQLVTMGSELAAYFKTYAILHENAELNDLSLFLEIFRGIVPEHSNIQGGIGVFGGYLVDSKTVNL